MSLPHMQRPRLASLMTCYGSGHGDCVRSKAALLICCRPQSQALHSTSPGWRFKRGIWERRGRKHATYQHWAEPYRSSQTDTRGPVHRGVMLNMRRREPAGAMCTFPWTMPMRQATSLIKTTPRWLWSQTQRHALPNKGKSLSCCIKLEQKNLQHYRNTQGH